MPKIYMGFCRDHSASMRPLAAAAARDYNELIAQIRNEALTQEIDTIVSVVKCGAGRGLTLIERESVNSSITVLKPIAESQYTTTGTSTPLYDSVGDLITQFESMPDANDPDVLFFINVHTDGEENSSRTWTAAKLSTKIRSLQSTDRWSFAFRVPRNGTRRLIQQLGNVLHEGNVLEWDTSTKGMTDSTVTTRAAFTKYYTDVKLGKKSTDKFFTDLKNVSQSQIKNVLTDISSEVSEWHVRANDPLDIREFCEHKSGKPMLRGAGFYELTKAESIQDHKRLIIRDRSTRKVYSGDSARELLQLPTSGTHKVVPGNHGNYDIFVQSTSVNRKLVTGTRILYWARVGVGYKEGQSATSTQSPLKLGVDSKNRTSDYGGVHTSAKTPTSQLPNSWPFPMGPAHSPAPTRTVNAAGHTPAYVTGYIAGFERGRSKLLSQLTQGGDDGYSAGYVAGYKDGKGKKKRLYK